MKCSLLISTYNWPKALDFCLQSVLRQTLLPDEILIADDGSAKETQDLIHQYQDKSPVPLLHIWHEDQGFQLAAIRNKAIAKASQAYIIQIDGDVILDDHFIEDHLKMAKKDCFVIGSRSLLSKEFTQRCLQQNHLPKLSLFKREKWANLNRLRNGLFSRMLANHYKVKGKHKYYAKGCNMAFWKEGITSINGYNENFVGWGSEDVEIAVRLIKFGQKKLFLKMGGVVYHLWHTVFSRNSEVQNKQMLQQAIDSPGYRCEKGIDQYI